MAWPRIRSEPDAAEIDAVTRAPLATRKTVVSLTPLPLAADSRTLKQAASVQRLGLRSVVIEGRPSAFAPAQLPFDVLSVPAPAGGALPSSGPSALPPTLLPRFFRYLFTYLDRYFFAILRLAPRADLYYLHAFYQFPAVFLLCLRYRAHMIYDAHDFYAEMEDEANVSSLRKRWVMPLEGLLERACVRFAADVVTVNEGIAELMRNRFGCKPTILRNVHDCRLDEPSPSTIRRDIGLKTSEFLVVSIGNWKHGMAMAQMLEALSTLPRHVHLAFLGKGYPSLDQAVAARGLEGRVHLMPPVLPQHVVPYIADADASVVLYYGQSINYQNALPNRFFQSIAAKLPLIYPDLAEMRRIAEAYGVGLMADPRDPSQIANALACLLSDPSARAAIRGRLEIASRALAWDVEEAVLRDLLARRLGPLASAPERSVEPLDR